MVLKEVPPFTVIYGQAFKYYSSALVLKIDVPAASFLNIQIKNGLVQESIRLLTLQKFCRAQGSRLVFKLLGFITLG